MLGKLVRTGSVLAALLAAAIPLGAAAQNGQVTGTVTDAETGQPLPTVQVFIQGTQIGGLTTATGTFSLANVPPGTYTVVAQRIGYTQARQANVTVTAGQTVTLTFQMAPAVLALQGVVATGLVDPVEGVRSPITVSAVTREMMPVTVAGAAIQNLQGRVSGMRINRASGQPGSEVTMMLRTPTSITQSGAPLIVVDGVILSGTNTVDIESLDIEGIEVIKGAAASSLYGSRAAAGVIAITTSRGRGLEVGQTRFNARTEIGFSQAIADNFLAKSHRFLMDPTHSFYVDEQGNRVERNQRVSPPLNRAFNDKPYPGETYDNVGAIMRAGAFRSNSLSISGNAESTNFAITLNNYVEEGALQTNKGYNRNSIRMNLDHRFMDALSAGVSMYHARDGRDNIVGNPFTAALQAPLDVDFSKKDENGRYLQQPDPTVNVQNPLWTQQTRDDDQKSTRTLIGIQLSWSPLSWMTASGSVGYDRSDFERRIYVPKGTPNNIGTDGTTDGSISFENNLTDTWNGEAQVSFRRDFNALNVRTTFRGLIERSRTEGGVRSGQNFILFGVPQLGNIRAEDRDGTSTEQEIRATGYLWDTAFDYDGKYIFTVLGRRDGSSLFGPENRWHNYYRVAAAWRIGQEPWFNIPHVSEFKLSFARGTAGGRPGFSAQYETWTLSNGIPTKGTLGNRFLAPEHTTENEVSLNAILFDRIGVVLTHAWQTTTDQLVQAPQSVITGYTSQWVNAGAVSGHTTEFEIEGQIIRRQNFNWTSMVVADYSYSEITEWDLPCDASNSWRYYCKGEPVYGLYSLQLVESFEQLVTRHRGGDAAGHLDEFDINDEGLVVWVGKGRDYRDGPGPDGVLGTDDDLWGTFSGNIGGRTYEWGMPFWEQNELGQNLRQLIGTSNPVNLGWVNNVRWGNWNFHAQMRAAIGGDANNRIQHTLVNSFQAEFMDQTGKPEGLKKPVNYYQQATQGDGSYTVHDASFLKLSTLSATYQMNQAAVERLGLARIGLKSATIGLIARNVFTLSHYSSWDPEAAVNLSTRVNSDAGGYPPTRNITAEISVTF